MQTTDAQDFALSSDYAGRMTTTAAEQTYPRQTDPINSGCDFLDIVNQALGSHRLHARVWWFPDGPERCTLRAEVDAIGQDEH